MPASDVEFPKRSTVINTAITRPLSQAIRPAPHPDDAVALLATVSTIRNALISGQVATATATALIPTIEAIWVLLVLLTARHAPVVQLVSTQRTRAELVARQAERIGLVGVHDETAALIARHADNIVQVGRH